MAIQLSSRSWREQEDENLVSKPQLVGYYSIDSDKTYLPDSSKLLYHNPQDGAASSFPTARNCHEEKARFDLDRGKESIGRSSHFPTDGKPLFNWIKLNHTKIQAPAESDQWIEPNFVCGIGSLLKLLCTPYAKNEGWIMRAAMWKGTIYLSACKSVSSDGFRMSPNDSKKFSDWNNEFDQCMLSDIPDEKPDTYRPSVNSGEFRGVYKIRFGAQTVLFDAVIKGVISETPLTDPLPLKDLKFVQLRTSRVLQTDRQKQSFRRFKLLKWCCHGFLINADKCVCGFRDDDGIVHKLVTYRLEQMMQMSKSYWKLSNCTDFCEAFLRMVAETVVDDCFATIYKFERRPHEEGIHITTLLPSTRYTVIPPSFFQ